MSAFGTVSEKVPAMAGMQWIPTHTFRMGSDEFYPEESPSRFAAVDGFWMDTGPVTNAMFARFVHATGYQTFAEKAPEAQACPRADTRLVRAGSLVFVAPVEPVPLNQPAFWWQWIEGADWRHPYGPESALTGLENHPVVHVAYEDAMAYALWAGKRLPSEAEWEAAARGGLDNTAYAWGDTLEPDGQLKANYWQGDFPWRNTLADGYLRTSPVGSYPPNGWGLFDMIGNVWEWTKDPYRTAAEMAAAACGCSARSHPGIERHVVKGGSHLCAPDYCQRYRPAARLAQALDTTTSHVGFRCVASRDTVFKQDNSDQEAMP